MNNFFFYYKFLGKFLLSITLLFSYFGIVDAATIESKSTGGYWISGATWVGGVVPGVGDNVVINGNVTYGEIYRTVYGNLTINEGGNLYSFNSNSKINLTVNGNLINNGILGGSLSSWRGINVNILGKTINNGEISNVKLIIYDDIENNGAINSGFYLGKDVEITKKQDFNTTIYLNGYKLKVQNNTYISSLSGNGEINSSTSENGDGEYIYFSSTTGNIKSNFEYMNSKNNINSGFIVRNTIIDSSMSSQWLGTVNGNLIITEEGYLYGANWNTTPNLIINGDLINNGTLGGSLTTWRQFNTYVKGTILNNGTISNIYNFYIYGDFENNGIFSTSSPKLAWDSFGGYNDYYINLSYNNGSIEVNNSTSYNIPLTKLTSGESITWSVLGNGLIYDNPDGKGDRCINIPGCVSDNNGPLKFNPNDVINNNSNPICSENISSGENIFDISELIIKTGEAESKANISEDSSKGDPVILSTGEFDYENTLMSYAGNNLPFEFKIKYKNQAYYNGPLGNNFDFNYNIYLTQDETGNINIHDGKLGVFKFIKNGNFFDRNETIKANLELVNSKYEITFFDKTKYIFGDNFKIEKIIYTYGNNLSFEYNSDKQLVKIIDTLNREYILSYYGHSRIYKIRDFAGNEVEFVYFGENEIEGSQFDLKTIKMINGNSQKEISFTYTIGTDFESSHNIVKLIDSANNTYVENTYDINDRVSSQTYGNGTIYYAYTLDTNNKITKNSVTDREGNVIDYYYDSFGNTIKKVIKKTSGDLEYTYTYDSNNNLIKEKNPLGNGFTYSYDSKNNLIERRQKSDVELKNSTNDIVMSFEYDDVFNKVIKEILPNGTTINYTLDNFGNVVQKETISGNIEINESFEYNELGQLVSKTDPNGNISNFEYINGNLSKIIKIGTEENIETNFEYDSKGNIIKITDGEGSITNLSYDDFNMLQNQTTPEGIHTNFEYNSLNKKTKETIILNEETDKITSFEYDILDNPTQVTTNIDSLKNKTIVTKYDTNSRIIETQNGSNAKNTFEYDENGNITKKSTILNDSTSITTSYIYDLNDRLIKQINPNNSEINFEYDLFDRLVKAVNSDNSYTTNTYDNMGNVLETKSYNQNDNLVGNSSFVYDGLSRKAKQINHLLEENKEIITSFVYDNNGNILTQTNALNQTTSFEYDSFNRLVKTIDNLGNIIDYKYNKNDKITQTKLTQTNGKTIITNYEYDSDNRLTKEIDNLGSSKTYSYNNLNQVIGLINGNGIATNYIYDYNGNVLTQTIEDKIISYEYDIYGNKTKLIDTNGNGTKYEYDELNRLTKQTYPDNSSINYEYDINSNVSKKVDGNGTIINYTYDNQNRLTEKNIILVENVLGITKENYFYDSLGRLTKTTNNELSETLFSYDSLNRLTSETQNGKLVNYTYDNLGNRTSISIDGKTTGYNYDSNSRLETITRENSELVSYNYDSLNLTSQTYANGKTTTYTYDEINRLKTLNNENIKSYTYTYDNNSNILDNGLDTYNYDNLNQIIYANYNIKLVNKETNSYTYDQMGNREIEYQTRTNKNGKIINKTFNYSTNNLNQYTDKIIYNPNNEEEVDEIIQDQESEILEPGNIEATNGNDDDNLQDEEELIELNGKLIYDKNGNMIGNMLNNKRQYIYSYDYKNRLVKVEKTIYKTIEGSETNEIQEIVKIIQYRYDNLDRRIQKIFNNGSYTNYYYSNKDIILEENYTKPNTNGISKLKTSKYFINGNSIDDVLAMEKVDYKTRKVQEEYTNKKGQIKTRNITENYTETNTYYYHKNHLNSIVAITDNLSNILEEYEYDVFGKPYSKDILTGKVTNLKASAIGNTRLFTGREFERGLQLYYNRARYYNPELGRFISRDPIDISDDVNLYSYVGNSPVSYSDVLGLAKQFGINFVREYDKFLIYEADYQAKEDELNALIINPFYYGSYSYFKSVRTEAYNTMKAQEKIVKELHYSRNEFNVDAGNNLTLVNNNEWGELPLYLSWYHQQTANIIEPNRKFISNDGHYETIYESNGNIENDIRDIGTYNIFDPVNDGDNHIKYDIAPYYKWGNGLNDDTNRINRHTGF